MTSTAPQNVPSLPALKSVSVIQFGPGTGADPVLFVGDSRSATLFAFELGPVQAPAAAQFYNFHDLDVAIAGHLGAPVDEIAVKGLAVHPVSQDAYIAVQRGHGDRMLPVIVKVNARREIAALDLAAIPGTHVALPNPIGEGTETRNHLKTRNFTITSLAFHGGEVLVSGLSNADFASTLYRIPYPFQGAVAASSIEMYHAMHAQTETRAPIQTMAIMQLGGAPHVLARSLDIPVVNAGDGLHEHPSQGLLDAYTILRHKKNLKGLRVAIVGDIFHSRVARSATQILTRFGAQVTLCGPPELCPEVAGTLAKNVSVVRHLDPAIRGVDVVMMLRIQKERLAGLNLDIPAYVAAYQLTAEKLRIAKRDAIVMHPGPMLRGLEIAGDVADSPQSVIREQVQNGVAVRMAILAWCLGAAK